MIEKVFYNVFIFGTIISICISPLLIFLYKNKYRYKLKSIYKVFMIILLLLILPINTINFSNMKGWLREQEIVATTESFMEPMETEIILETVNTVVEVKDGINIKNNKLSSFAQLVPYLWISISSIFLLYNIITYSMCLYEGKKKYIEIKVSEIDEKINKICKNMNIKKISYAFFSENITTPMVVGIFNKRIILPVNILEVENYEMILMHEIVHIKNKDIECKFLLLLINSIYWFNPIIYKFIAQVEEVLELKCDEIVLENQPQIYKMKYAQVLLNQIEENRNSKYRFSLNFANKRRNIMKRFSNIVNKSKKKNMIGISCVTVSIIIISSAIVVSLPNINFASIQESAFCNEVDDNFVLEENANEIVYKNTMVETEESFNNINSNEINVKNVSTKVTDLATGEVIEENSSDEEFKQMAVAVIPESICPLENYNYITSRFSGNYNHTGIDFQADEGTPIRASASGIVVYSGYKGSYGNIVIIDHGNEFQTYYAQCKELNVKLNERVEQGDIIATVGSTGNSTGPHLHFETRNRGTPVNPENILNRFLTK